MKLIMAAAVSVITFCCYTANVFGTEELNFEEKIREYSIRMVKDAIYQSDSNSKDKETFRRLLSVLDRISITANSGIYPSLGRQWGGSLVVEIHPDIGYAFKSFAAGVLLHEAAHALGNTGECEADLIAIKVARLTPLSFGLSPANYDGTPGCNFVNSLCGASTIQDRFVFRSKDSQLDKMRPEALRSLLTKIQTIDHVQIDEIFIGNRVSNWIGGDACKKSFDWDLAPEVNDATGIDTDESTWLKMVVNTLIKHRTPIVKAIKNRLNNPSH